ncbi:MAG: DUF4214 domain-containing protein [Clostridiales bacterium]|nr:DUF4214 domain-containing protein [Clostridiales bacterium]
MRFGKNIKKRLIAVALTVAMAFAAFPAGTALANSKVSDQQYQNLCTYYDNATAFLVLYGDKIPADVYAALDTARNNAYPVFEDGDEYAFGIAISDLRMQLSVAQAALMNDPTRANGAPGAVMGTFDGINEGIGILTGDAAVNVAATYSSSRNLPIYMAKSRITGEFVDRIYRSVLGRSSDDAGRQYWVTGIENGTYNPDDVVLTILNSQEFVGRNLNNEQYVTALYQAFLNRTPDSSGLANWVNALNNGASRQDIARGFASSAEWGLICEYYGLEG